MLTYYENTLSDTVASSLSVEIVSTHIIDTMICVRCLIIACIWQTGIFINSNTCNKSSYIVNKHGMTLLMVIVVVLWKSPWYILAFFCEIATRDRNILRYVHVPRCLCNRRTCSTSKTWYIWGIGVGFCTWFGFLALFKTSIFSVLPLQIETCIRYTEKPWAV